MSAPVLTMTGIDARTSTNWIKEMGRVVGPNGYPALEFAILRSPKVGQSPRYPDRDAVSRITSYVYPQQLAFHLCGRYARMVHDLEWRELCDVIDFRLVGRVQVNSTECDEKAMITLQRFSVYIGKPVIMQWRGDTFPCVPNLHLLQDRSGGRGIAETEWIRPDDLCAKSNTRIGYAGGLNPSNVREALPKIAKAARGRGFWIDCESGIRTADDWFDQAKAEEMISAVVDLCGVQRR